MLDQITLGQTRFQVPGLTPDPRGVAIGPKLCLLLSSIDRVVAFFRIISAEQSLDELLPTLAIHKVKSDVGALSMVVSFDTGSSYLMDRAARAARLAGGLAFTGASKHFVKCRDDRAPFGYDAEVAASARGDFILYGDDFTSAFLKQGEVAFSQLLLGLELSLNPAGAPDDLDESPTLYLAVALGLGENMVRYLVRSRVAAEVALVTPKSEGTFRADRGGFLLVRARELPPRMVRLFTAVPGVELFAAVADNVAVEVGYKHPIHLPSVAALFPRERFFIFAGKRRTVEVIPGPLELTRADALTKVRYLPSGGTVGQTHAGAEIPKSMDVSLRLAQTSAPPTRVVGALIPLAQAPWLKKLVYALPPSALRDHRAALLDIGIVVLSRSGADVLPLGQLLRDSGHGILVPVGYELRPRISPEVLAERLGHGAGTLTLFALGLDKPARFDDADLKPLERSLLVDLETQRATPLPPSSEPAPGESQIVNDPVGSFALWGFKAEPPRAALPAASLPALPPRSDSDGGGE
ncbi:MAG: hypothetical protein IT370_13475 [Deltaproteobacteria bacterium]|nr:hypothetical protein [Deltaproteobacteria bacterium]